MMFSEQDAPSSPSPDPRRPASHTGVLALSARQQTTVASAVTVLAALVILCTLSAIVWLLAIFLRSFSNVILPLAVAAVVSLVLEPYYRWWVERLNGGRLESWKLSKVLSLLMVFFSILLPIAGVLVFFSDLLIVQVADMISGVVEKYPVWRDQLIDWGQARGPRVREIWEDFKIQEQLDKLLTEQGDVLADKGAALFGMLQTLIGKSWGLGANIFGGIGSLFSWVLVPIYVAFILIGDLGRERQTWSKAALPFLKDETRKDISYLVQEFVEIIVAFFRGQLLIAFLQGVLFATGFWLVDVKYGFILGLVLGFLNIIPYLGSIVGLGVTIPIALFQQDGGWVTAGSVLIVFTVVQMIEGYLLTPKIMGNQTGLHPMAIMVAIFFWGTALNGIMGMLLAIPLTAFFVVFWRLAQEKYITELV